MEFFFCFAYVMYFHLVETIPLMTVHENKETKIENKYFSSYSHSIHASSPKKKMEQKYMSTNSVYMFERKCYES